MTAWHTVARAWCACARARSADTHAPRGSGVVVAHHHHHHYLILLSIQQHGRQRLSATQARVPAAGLPRGLVAVHGPGQTANATHACAVKHKRRRPVLTPHTPHRRYRCCCVLHKSAIPRLPQTTRTACCAAGARGARRTCICAPQRTPADLGAYPAWAAPAHGPTMHPSALRA